MNSYLLAIDNYFFTLYNRWLDWWGVGSASLVISLGSVELEIRYNKVGATT